MKNVRLRPHHILCDRFLPLANLKRGEVFDQAIKNIHGLLGSNDDVMIEVTEGVDDLCMECPDRDGGRCENKHGNEEEVRKWDYKIVKGLGLSYGEIKRPKEFRELIAQRAPLEFCRNRCPWKEACSI